MAPARSRLCLRALTLAALGLMVVGGGAGAQEVLFLHIKPQAEPDALGTAGASRAGLAAREAVWERSNARARVIIESVCTGCLGPWAQAAPKPRGAPKLIAASAATEIPAVRGVETDPPLEASEPTSDPASREKRP
ncbi:MAG: hypothetical protein INR70_14900 [Parafilimonas terrae]|nr:hypothetical protein [Parafilimonas terrae]